MWDALLIYSQPKAKVIPSDELSDRPIQIIRSATSSIRGKYKRDFYPRQVKKPVASGYRGVTVTPSGRFEVTLYLKTRKLSLGTYDAEIDAALRYDSEAKKRLKHKAILNFPDIRKKQNEQN